jgi:hypothetical protein
MPILFIRPHLLYSYIWLSVAELNITREIFIFKGPLAFSLKIASRPAMEVGAPSLLRGKVIESESRGR